MKVTNRKFNRDYEEIEKYEVGISLTGPEVKSTRAGRIKIEDSFVKILGSEVYLINADIQVYEYSRPQGYDSRRTRKLLLHKKEIIRLKTKLAGSGRLAIVPVSCYNKDSLIKLEIALARGRKDIEKKKLEKKRDVALEQKREAKEYLKS
jgi:SsrA-binding protein